MPPETSTPATPATLFGTDATRTRAPLAPAELRVDVAHAARMYDYYLGGKDHFPADRDAAEAALLALPTLRIAARQNRSFLLRATRHLTEVGIRQFLDIGTGIPTSPNLHEVAQTIAPDSRIVYTDNDPLVLAHARALLTSVPQGATAYLDADLHDPDRILTSPELHDTLDLTRPVALSLIAILHFLPDDHDPYNIVRRLMDALPSGSYLALTHITADHDREAVDAAAEVYRQRGIPVQARSIDDIECFVDGLDLLYPGVRLVHRWRPDDGVPPGLTDAQVSVYGAVARKS
ncbi:SAM-dependent methyltransferase [Frankia sp. R82]|uniref:SAM-dependent methyltransferase n=1 Tax=Frankia sp. R82 TaxID=2950553 RepID=UPI0020435981|nr:SAM-dependent methyltransferase [Frankia sp. R82]MCM3883526.1 SAM-dependent methyltransferase [Frankia sp. R82]